MKLFPFCCFLRLCPCVYLPRGIKSQRLTNCLIQNIYTEEVHSLWPSHVSSLCSMIGQRDIMKLLDHGCWSMMAAYGAIRAPKADQHTLICTMGMQKPPTKAFTLSPLPILLGPCFACILVSCSPINSFGMLLSCTITGFSTISGSARHMRLWSR